MLISCSLDPAYFPVLLEDLLQLALEARAYAGVEVSFIDLSGGVGIPYRPEEEPVDMEAVSVQVRKVYDRLAMPNGLSPRLYMELGRYVTGPMDIWSPPPCMKKRPTSITWAWTPPPAT